MSSHPEDDDDTSTSNPPPSTSPHPSATCWRTTCRHSKCVNCALYAGPLCGRDHGTKLLIRTVGGLHASPRFVDPVYWECPCGEWIGNKFDSRCVLGLTVCKAVGCAFRWRVPGGGSHGGFGFGGMGVGMNMNGFVPVVGGGGVLTGESVVMNRYGQRLGTADQRVLVADGPWDWQRRALGDGRCAVVGGLRAAMKRTGEGMELSEGGSRSRTGSMCELGRLWKEGEPVPHYPYRRPPPVDENDVAENNEYEGSYLASMPTEPLDKGKGVEQQYTAPGSSPGLCSALSSVSVSSVPVGFFPGWNHLQM